MNAEWVGKSVVVATVHFRAIRGAGDDEGTVGTADEAPLVIRFFLYDLLQFRIESLWLVDYLDDVCVLRYEGFCT